MSQTTANPSSHDAVRDLPEEPVSYADFLAWADEDVRAEWVDGDIQLMAPASSRHQDLVRFLTMLFGTWVEHYDVGVVRPAPFQMKLKDRGREPDLMVIRTENTDRLQEHYLEGPADIVVEIVSASSGPRDRGDKFYEYESAGVQEYLLIDPEREMAVLYRRREDGRYQTAFEGDEGRMESTVLDGLWLRAEWFWREELPKTFDVYQQWGVID